MGNEKRFLGRTSPLLENATTTLVSTKNFVLWALFRFRIPIYDRVGGTSWMNFARRRDGWMDDARGIDKVDRGRYMGMRGS